MSFLESFLGGAAGAGAGIISQQMKDEQELKAREQLARLNEELYTQREKTVLGLREAMDIRAEERKAEPLKRMGSLVGKYQNEEVPMEAEKATTTKGIINRETMLGVDGKPIQSAGPGDRGLATGIGNKDFNSMRQQIINDPNVSDEDRAGVLAQIDAQERQQQDANNAAVQGKTRKRTSDEAMGLARDEAMSTDPAALAAWEQSIGRPMREEKKIDVNANKAAASLEQKARADALKNAIDLKRLDLQTGSQELQNKKIDAMIEHWERADAKKTESKDSPERLYSVVNAMNTTIKNMQDGSKGKTPEEKAEFQRQLTTAMRVRDRAAALLEENLSFRGAPASSGEAPKAEAPKAPQPLKSASGYPKPKTSEEFNKLESGTVFEAPDGSIRTKP